MKKVYLIFLSVCLLSIIIISASTPIINVPKGMTFQQYKDLTTKLNSNNNFLQTMIGASGYTWANCYGECSRLDVLYSECYAFSLDWIVEGCTVFSGTSESGREWNTEKDFCADTSNGQAYNRVCWASQSVNYAGCQYHGANYNSGEKICAENSVVQCSKNNQSNLDVWNIIDYCENGCSNSKCNINLVVCSTDIKTCSDGSNVNRDPNNNCQFYDCPIDNQIICPTDIKVCPDGSLISRNPSNCQFYDCPNVQCEESSYQKCVGNDVYWFDSCGNQGEKAIACDSNEECVGNKCIKVDNNVDCTTNAQCSNDEKCTISTCSELSCNTNEIANQHQCVQISTKEISKISITKIIIIILGVLLIIYVIVIMILMIKKRS